MEFNCPTCQTKLGVSDELENPKVRCRVCGTIFRPFESDGASRPNPQSQASPSPSQVNPFPDQPRPTVSPSPFESTSPPKRDSFSPSTSPVPARPRPVITQQANQRRRKGGWGIAFFVILMILSRAPRLWRNFQRKPAPPAPIVIDHDEIMRQFEDRIEKARQMENEDIPESPAGGDPADVNPDGEAP